MQMFCTKRHAAPSRDEDGGALRWAPDEAVHVSAQGTRKHAETCRKTIEAVWNAEGAPHVSLAVFSPRVFSILRTSQETNKRYAERRNTIQTRMVKALWNPINRKNEVGKYVCDQLSCAAKITYIDASVSICSFSFICPSQVPKIMENRNDDVDHEMVEMWIVTIHLYFMGSYNSY